MKKEAVKEWATFICLLVISMLTLNHGDTPERISLTLSLLSQKRTGVSRREPQNEAC